MTITKIICDIYDKDTITVKDIVMPIFYIIIFTILLSMGILGGWLFLNPITDIQYDNMNINYVFCILCSQLTFLAFCVVFVIGVGIRLYIEIITILIKVYPLWHKPVIVCKRDKVIKK